MIFGAGLEAKKGFRQPLVALRRVSTPCI